MDALGGRHPRPPADRRSRPGGGRRRGRPGPDVAAVVATSGHHQRRHHRRPRRRRPVARRTRLVVPRRRRVRRRRALRALAAAGTPGIELADSFILDPHKWLFTPFDCCALLYRDPALARACTPRTRRTSTSSTPSRRRVEPDRLRLPPHPAGPRPAAVVLARGPRRRRLPRGDRGGGRLARDTADVIKAAAAPGAGPRAGPRRRAVPPARLAAGGLRRLGEGAARRRGRVHPAEPSGRARRSAGSRSCTRTPRWTWCGRSSTGRTDAQGVRNMLVTGTRGRLAMPVREAA